MLYDLHIQKDFLTKRDKNGKTIFFMDNEIDRKFVNLVRSFTKIKFTDDELKCLSRKQDTNYPEQAFDWT